MANSLAWISMGNVYLLQQDFESAGTPPGWTNGGGATFHNTVAPLEGTGDLLITAGSGNFAYSNLSSSANEVWCVWKFLMNALPTQSVDMMGFTTVNNQNGTALISLQISNTGGLKLFNNASLVGTAVANLSISTLYYCWLHYKLGSGANSVSSIGMGTTTTEVTSGNLYVSGTSGAATSQAGSIQFDNDFGTGGSFQFDHIRVATQDYGNFVNWT